MEGKPKKNSGCVCYEGSATKLIGIADRVLVAAVVARLLFFCRSIENPGVGGSQSKKSGGVFAVWMTTDERVPRPFVVRQQSTVNTNNLTRTNVHRSHKIKS